MKNTSTWIDNSKIRKELYDFNQSVKGVYDCYRYLESGIVIPHGMSNLKNSQLFSRSLFIRKADDFGFLKNTVVNPTNLNVALKNKMYSLKSESGNHSLSNDSDSLVVSVDLPEKDISDSANYRAIKFFTDNKVENYPYQYTLTDDDRKRMIEYQVVTLILGHDDEIDSDVKLITTKELFPIIKKANSISIFTTLASRDMGTYTIAIVSQTNTWTFYSAHVLLLM